MTDLRDVHATIFVAQAIAGPIEAARRDWDPLMAARIAAHVTLVYPEEAPNCDLLLDRIRGACSITPPFRLRLGELRPFEGRDRGVYVSVDDIDGGFHTMREQVLRPPFSRLAFRPHVTVMHPRTSRRLPNTAPGVYGAGDCNHSVRWHEMGGRSRLPIDVHVIALKCIKAPSTWLHLDLPRARAKSGPAA